MSHSGRREVETRVFYDPQHGVWSSPNACAVPRAVPGFDMEIPARTRYQDFRAPRWLSNEFPYLAFWPIYVSFTGPIFSRLNFSNSTIGVEKVGRDKYCLARATMTSWQRLEGALVGLSMILLKRKFGNAAELSYLPLPSECGYTSTHSEPRYVKGCAFKSRDAFVTLSTLCSFAIAANMSPSDADKPEPDWVTFCRGKGGHVQWLTDLQNSFLCTFSPGFRPGAFMHGYKSSWAQAIPAFLNANVPLWIMWGREAKKPMDVRMVAYLPSKIEVDNAKASVTLLPPDFTIYEHPDHHTEEQFSYDLAINNEIGGPNDIGEAPEPEPGSHQLKGETVEEFSNRMESDKHDLLKEFAMPETVDGVSSKEADAQRVVEDDSVLEPAFGRAMYVWVNRPHGYRLRKLVPREQWSTCWSRCPPASRRYFYFIDEWDLQMDVTNEIMPTNEDISALETVVKPDDQRVIAHRPGLSSQNHEDAVQPQLVIRSPSFIDLREEARRYFAEEVAHVYGSTVFTNAVEIPSLERVLRNRYGFCLQGVYKQHPRMQLHGRVSASTQSEAAAMSRLGLKAYVPHERQTAVLDLFNYVVYQGERPVAFPPLWDFNPTLMNDIKNHPYFQFFRVCENFYLIGVKDKPLIDQWYLLAIPDACTILQVFREKEGTLLAVVRSLLARGIEFDTLKCVRTLRSEKRLEERQSVGLGCFKTPPEFDVTTYVAYEKAKRNVISSSMGRVALTRGGIVWRLAQGLVKVKYVTKGLNFTQCTSFGMLEDHELVADGLPQADEDIICGVYHIRTGGQDTEISWWPKTNTWRNSGYNVGYWSADCEKWYQDRLTQIQNGKAELYTATKWRELLRLKSSHTAQFVNGMNKMADMLLQENFRYWSR